MKKLVPALLLVVIVFNFIFCNMAYADLDDASRMINRYGGNSTVSGESAKSLAEEGKDSSGTTMKHSNFGISLIGIIFQCLASVIDIVPIAIQGIISLLTQNPQEAISRFSIERTVFDEISLFNPDIFEQDDTYTIGSGENEKTIHQSDMVLKVKESATGWFYTIRLLAMMINLCVLIYVGIRMAVTSIASEEAKYKKMLIWWAESMVVLFCLHYIIYALLYVGRIIMNIIITLKESAIANKSAVSFEYAVMDRIDFAITYNSGTNFFMYSLVFWFLISLQIKFLITYMKRTFSILFLVVISPLITVTYPLDKLGNGKAEAFEIWLKEFLINITIQPIHAIIYLIFVYTAGEIAKTAPWVAFIFLLSLGRVENIVRNIFKITDSVQNVDMARQGGKGKGIKDTAKMFFAHSGK